MPYEPPSGGSAAQHWLLGLRCLEAQKMRGSMVDGEQTQTPARRECFFSRAGQRSESGNRFFCAHQHHGASTSRRRQLRHQLRSWAKKSKSPLLRKIALNTHSPAHAQIQLIKRSQRPPLSLHSSNFQDELRPATSKVRRRDP